MMNYGSTRDDAFISSLHSDREAFSRQSADVSSNIISIASEVSRLERLLKLIGTKKDGVKLRNDIHDMNESIKTMVTKTKTTLATMTHSTHNTNIDRSQRLVLERSRNEFAQTVSNYGRVQNLMLERLKVAVKPSATDHQQQPSSTKSSGIPQTTGWGVDEDDHYDDDPSRAALLQQQRELEVEVEIEADMLREREAGIRQIEADMLDINQIFRELAAMVAEQGEVIDTIEDHIEKAFTNVEQGNVQLIKASQYQRKYRRKVCILLVIFLIVAAVVAIIVAVSVKKK